MRCLYEIKIHDTQKYKEKSRKIQNTRIRKKKDPNNDDLTSTNNIKKIRINIVRPNIRNLRDYSIASPINKTISCIITDLKGPFATEGLQGEKYYQGFIEKDTRFLHCYFLKTKSDALDNLKHLLNIKLKSEGCKLTAYQSDGAGELISANIISVLANYGAKMTYSAAYVPKLNADIERNHRTIFESGHAMLIAAPCAIVFWCYAIKYAVLI